MNNNEALNEFFVWEENNSTGLNQNSLKNAEKDKCVITTETKTNVENLHWKDITDPKLRKKAWSRANYIANKEKKKLYYINNKEKISLYQKIYWGKEKNKLKKKKYNKKYSNPNKQKLYSYSKTYRENNKDKRKVYWKKYYESNKQKLNDYRKNCDASIKIKYKLSNILRSRLRMALKNNQKVGSAVQDLGCSIDELKTYLESKFQSGMSWDNYGINGWHIDHIKPLASFDLTDRKQFLEACHYKNLQPLWAKDNLIKGDKLIQQSF